MIRSPVLIVGCARSGTSLLYNVLSELPDLWSIGFESKAIIERYHHPRTKEWISGELDASDLTAQSSGWMLAEFERQSAPGGFWQRANSVRRRLAESSLYRGIKRRGTSTGTAAAASATVPGLGLDGLRALVRFKNSVVRPQGPIRLLEKTPENCLRLPFLQALFPDARIIFLTRSGPPNVSSLMEGWRHPHLFSGYQVPVRVAVPGLERDRWAFTLIPGWQALVDRPLAEVCARQWVDCNQVVLDYLEQPGALDHLMLRLEDLVCDPAGALARVCAFIGADRTGVALGDDSLPVINALGDPNAGKWRKNAEALALVRPLMAGMMATLGYNWPD